MEKYIATSDLPEHSENLFGLEAPERYSCRVWKYNVGHSVMAIKLQHIDDQSLLPLDAIFETVTYFEGIMWWNGANLKTSSRDEYFKLWMKVYKVPENLIAPSDRLGIKLFKFDTDNGQVKILASGISLADDISHFLLG